MLCGYSYLYNTSDSDIKNTLKLGIHKSFSSHFGQNGCLIFLFSVSTYLHLLFLVSKLVIGTAAVAEAVVNAVVQVKNVSEPRENTPLCKLIVHAHRR